MEQIRVKSGIDIEVNDNGDVINVRVDDANFIEQFEKFSESLQGVKTAETSEGRKEQIGKITDELDKMLGEGASKKIFGEIIPSPYLIVDFLEQLGEVVQKFNKQRATSIEQKYSKNRKHK